MIVPGQSFAKIVTTEGASDFGSNTLLAAAAMACGVKIQTHKHVREKTGEVQWRFDYQPAQPVFGGALTANQLVHFYRDGSFEKADPNHPMLWCVAALRNRERILEWITSRNGDRAAALVKHPLVDRWQYESAPRAELPAAMIGIEPLQTQELKVICALGCFGVPMIRASGPVRDAIFHVCSTGFPGATTAPVTSQLADDFYSGEMERKDPQHPFFYAWSAVECIQTLKRHMAAEIAVGWIEKPRNRHGVSAFIRADATAQARDTMHQHFRRTG